jgi:phosphoenolpyruvate-protein phosphotransferase (PTS system enzyme I)
VILTGTGVCGGTAVGTLVLLSGIHEMDRSPGTSTSSPEESLDRLRSAVETSRVEIEELTETARERLGAEHAAIIHVQVLVLDDPEWLDPIVNAIGGGASPETAVWSVSREVAGMLATLTDDYLKERASDVLDVAQRVAGHLTGRSRSQELSDLCGDVIIGAHELTPTDTINLDLSVVRGIVTEIGARTSHAAIIARQLGIPAVVGVTGLLAAATSGHLVIVNGDDGTCVINPDAASAKAAVVAAAARSHRPVIVERVVTRDGIGVAVMANASSPEDVERAVRSGADGIGLFRTEFFYMQSDGLPDEGQQFAYYDAVATAAEGRPVTFRTLDVGGDKPVPGLPMPAEENPFLGVRGIRLALQHRAVLEDQLRALARTAARHPGISVMVPMVSGFEELDDVREVMATVIPEAVFAFGTMVEVPSIVMLVREIVDEVDFISVGTNDLTAYLLAADRGNRDLDYLYTEFHPAVLRVLHRIRADADETPVSVCGEFAGDSRSLALLLGLGYRSLSVSAPLVPEIKARVRAMDVGAVRPIVERLLQARRHADVDRCLVELRESEAGN